MATSGSGTSSPAQGVTYSKTLGQIITEIRERLDDTLTPYLWSNDELTGYFDKLMFDLCAEFPIIEDKDTADICSVTIAQGDGAIDIDNRITHIERARIDGEASFLTLTTRAQMDEHYGDWEGENTTVTQSTPTKLIIRGVGTYRGYLYPPSDASGTLELVVFRLPLEHLDYGEHSGLPTEIDRFQHLMLHGVMAQAYLKDDADALDLKKAETHRVLWEGQNGRGGDKDKIRRAIMRYRDSAPTFASPMKAFM